jgi:hypothetical protein
MSEMSEISEILLGMSEMSEMMSEMSEVGNGCVGNHAVEGLAISSFFWILSSDKPDSQ